MNGAEKRCETTTWKMSPATMYSFARCTIDLYSAGVVFEVGLGAASLRGVTEGECGSGCSSAATTFFRRLHAAL